jgi:anti-sigma factor ChrR (cupin superfamily)
LSLTINIVVLSSASVGITLLADRVQAKQSPQTPGPTRTELRRIKYPTNYEIVQMYVDTKAGVEFPRHTHPGVESALILDGPLGPRWGKRLPSVRHVRR